MSSSLNRLRKKRGSPLVIDGDQYHIRSMTFGELDRLESLDKDLQTAFMLASCLVEEDGSPVLPMRDGEQVSDYAKRAKIEFDDIQTDRIMAITAAVHSLSKPAKPETVLKN